MKEISLTNSTEYALVDDADYEYLTQWRWQKTPFGYAGRCQSLGTYGKNKLVLMHHEILGRENGLVTDHINRDRLDNRRDNLRLSSYQQNNHNKSKQANNTSGFIGVTKATHERWKAFIYFENKRFHIAQGKDPEEMAYIRDQVAIQLFGEFANLNLEIL